MVRYRKPVERSEHIIDRRGASAEETARAKAKSLATQARWAREAKQRADMEALREKIDKYKWQRMGSGDKTVGTKWANQNIKRGRLP